MAVKDAPEAGHGDPPPVGQAGRDPYRPPGRILVLWRSTIGKKYVAAITGIILAIFVVLHMLGNLKAIEGAGGGNGAAIDSYAHFLRTAGSPVLPHDMLLWALRIVLISALILHLTAVGQLWARNRRSKPPAMRGARVRSTIWARTMPISGLVILGFLIFHLLQFTTRTIQVTPVRDGTVYANAYHAFHLWWVVVLYVAAVTLLGFHINHGLWSGAQTAGVDNPDRNFFWRRLATAVTVLTVVGFALVPLLFAFGALPKPIGSCATEVNYVLRGYGATAYRGVYAECRLERALGHPLRGPYLGDYLKPGPRP